LHRPLRAGDNLDDAFAWKEERRLSQALTLQYDKMIFTLEPGEPAEVAIGKYVHRFDYPDGRSATTASNSHTTPSTTFVRSTSAPSMTTSTWDRLLAMIRDEQLRRRPSVAAGPAGAISATLSVQGRLSLSYQQSGFNAVLLCVGGRCATPGPRRGDIFRNKQIRVRRPVG
jgi:hypothetical protein